MPPVTQLPAADARTLAAIRAKLASREGELPRIAIVADGIGAMHGVTRTIEEIRERGVEGFEIVVIGTDRNVDRRLAAVADVEIPHYPGMEIGVPSLPAAVEAIADGRYDLIHVCAPGPSVRLAQGLLGDRRGRVHRKLQRNNARADCAGGPLYGGGAGRGRSFRHD